MIQDQMRELGIDPEPNTERGGIAREIMLLALLEDLVQSADSDWPDTLASIRHKLMDEWAKA